MTGQKIDPHTHTLPLIEVNTFGRMGDARTCVVYWDWNGHVRDWRWWSEALRPDEIRRRWWMATWSERQWECNPATMVWGPVDIRYTVYAPVVYWTRTPKDREVEDREEWPISLRTKL